jgi:DNA-binding winged helix-turn-helix (wHTH) protein/Tol biopolymer transport system component
MRWKIKDFEFNEQQQTLISEDNQVRLEPMVCQLLAYFCQYQNQLLSKEQLLDDVWHGRYVSDNTVSKLITKLRKVMQDDARNPEYITTVPKRGYRFVATATPIIEKVGTCVKEDTTQAKYLNKIHMLILPLCFIFLVYGWLLIALPTPNMIVSAKAVTSDKGSEYFPSFTPDGIRLAYMNHAGERFKLYVKNIYSDEQVEVRHGDKNGVGPGIWNSTGTKLVYLVATQENCQYFIREFYGLTMSEPKLIYTCKAGSFGQIKFTHDDNVLIFSESPSMGKPYSLYTLHLDTGKKKWLPQPDLHLGGNSQFDLHPTENKLLISSPNEQQWEGFYQLDLDTQQLTLLFELNAYICCGIWSHDGEHVVMMGEHPASEIVQFDLDGNNKAVIFAGSQQLSRPERHSNGVDYTFTTFKYDLNVDEYNIADNKRLSILNDTFDERLAVLSPNSDQIAYISLTSGNEELWLYNRETDKKKKVTQYADGRHYVDLTWSPDASKVAGVTLNAIHIIDIITGETQLLPLPEKEFRGVSFRSANKVAFSMKIGSIWQVVELNLTDKTMVRLDPMWQSVQYDI